MSRSRQKRLQRIADQLNKLVEDTKKTHPRAQIYLEGSGNLCLLSDDSHDNDGRMHQERVLAGAFVPGGSGGGW